MRMKVNQTQKKRSSIALKAVFFDFWKTVVDFGGDDELRRLADLRVEGIVRLLTDAGCARAPDTVRQTMRQVDAAADKIRFGRNEEVSSKTIVHQILAGLGVSDRDPSVEAPIWKFYTDSLLAIRLLVLPGAPDALGLLQARGYRIGLISNTSYGEKLRAILANFNLVSFFDVLLFSDEFGIRKPRPEIFRAAIDRLSVSAREAVHIGDRVDLDVVGAKNAGFFSIYLNGNGAPYPLGYPEPDRIVHSLAEVPAAVEVINRCKMQSEK
jgi:putative hydrolase of the HAD superfamily